MKTADESIPHPNIHHTGSVRGMKKLRFWNKNDKTIRIGSYIYNVGSHPGMSSCKCKACVRYCKTH